MAEKIKIAQLDIDDKALLKSTADIKKEIDTLKKEQRELVKAGAQSSEVFVSNAADLKALSREYNANVKVLAQRTQAIADQENRQDLLNIALNTEVTTIAAAREQNKLLNQLRNTANVTTAEGAEEIEKLNAKLDANNELIKENADAYLKQKINIGNYSESIKEAFGELNIFNGGLGGFIERSKDAGGVGNLLTGSLKGLANGFIGLTRAALAFIATPVGAVLAAIVAAFALVRNALNRNEESVNKLKRAFAPFIGIVNGVLKALEPLGEFLINGIVKAFEFVEGAVFSALEALSTALDFLGFEGAAESLRGFNKELAESAKSAEALADAEARLQVEQRKSNRIQLQYQRDAERLRQIRDDENLSIRERIAANEELGRVLEEQLQEELKIAQLALEVANLRIEAEGQTSDLLDQQAEALERITDIQERIVGQESEQLTNRVALQREAADKAREAAEKRIEALEIENEIRKEQNRLSAESLEQIRTDAAEELKIFQEKLNSKLITEREFELERLRLQNEVLEAEKAEEQKELERIQDFENRKKELLDSIELANAEDESAKKLLKAEQDFQEQLLELERLELTENEKTQLLALLETQRQQVLDEIRNEAFEKQLNDYAVFSQKEIDARQQNASQIAGIAGQLTGILSGLLGDSLGARLAALTIDAVIQSALVKTTSAASQATNLAQAAAVAPPPFNVPFIAQAAAQNAIIQGNATAAVARILSAAAIRGIGTIAQGIRFEKGGIQEVGGKRHAAGGTKFYGEDGTVFEAEQGEGIGVLNRAAFKGFMAFNDSFNAPQSTQGRFVGGGIITQAVRPESSAIDQDQLINAISQLRVQVAVEDINDGQSSLAEVMSNADL